LRLSKARSRAGWTALPQALLQLEQKLARKFLLEDAEAREKEYATLSEEGRAKKYSKRHLREKLCNGADNEQLLALETSPSSKHRVHLAAKKLELHCESARGRERRIWTIVGQGSETKSCNRQGVS
jgi:hypothetical protein